MTQNLPYIVNNNLDLNMKYRFLFPLLFFAVPICAKETTDSLLMVLDKELQQEATYVEHKVQRISALMDQLKNTNKELLPQYNMDSIIYEEYKSFHYDSAFSYIIKLQNTAYQLNDEPKITSTKIRQGFIFLSSGMFKEAFDTLSTIHEASLPQIHKVDYFALMAVLYYGMADLNDRFYASVYEAKGHQYIDSVLKYSESDTYDFLYYRGLRFARQSNLQEGLNDLDRLISIDSLTFHQKAIIASTLSDIYLKMGEQEKAIQLLAKASIYDIRSATKETAAILTLADILYHNRDIKRAYTYTKKALSDANFYGARHRKIQVGTILPIIEEEKINTVEGQKRLLILYSIIATVLSICVVFFIFIILKQLRKLRKADSKILETNSILQETNHKLMEANKIKEEYIGYYFNINSDYIDKIDKFKKSIDRSLMTNRIDNLRYIVNSIDLKKERTELYQSFDKVFLKLFPDFIADYNALFREEDQVKLNDNELLNTDLRIFALIRMGISENDKIAKILEFSVNTIYAYKTKIKNKSIVPNEEFEKKIMEIKPI